MDVRKKKCPSEGYPGMPGFTQGSLDQPMALSFKEEAGMSAETSVKADKQGCEGWVGRKEMCQPPEWKVIPARTVQGNLQWRWPRAAARLNGPTGG